MGRQADPSQDRDTSAGLGSDFLRRVDMSLRLADVERRRRSRLRLARRLLMVAVLAAPLLAWHLVDAAPGGLHAAIDTLAWITFGLDVGVHVDSAILTYSGLQILPSLIGLLLLVLVPGWLLTKPRDER